LLVAALCAGPRIAAAQAAPASTFWFAGTRLIFDAPIALNGDVAVSIRDSGLNRLLARVGASLSYAPQQRYVLITAADRRIISLAIGDARYSVGGVVSTASFAPFFDGNDVIVFEPQLGALDVRPDGRRTIVTLHGATALRYVKSGETPERLELTFSGLGSALAPNRQIGGGVDEVDVRTAGSVRNPTSTVTIVAPKGAQHLIATAASPYEFTVVFGPPGVALDPSVHDVAAAPAPSLAPAAPQPPVAEAAPASPAAVPQAAPPAGPVTISDVAIAAQPDGGVRVRLSLDGPAAYTWHRLRDDRWYLDVADATLTQAGRDEHPASASVESVRVRQVTTGAAPTVRVAFTLHGDRRIDIATEPGALILTTQNGAAADEARSGAGRVDGASVAQTGADASSTTLGSAAPGEAPPQAEPLEPAPRETPWKFAPPSAVGLPAGNRIIVIDPGHGGDDAGTAHNGLVEKRLTLDISERLRALLVKAGWIVRMTRETDIDPISPAILDTFANDGKPNPSDRAYLQTRCDVANAVNARLFISIHINYSDAPSVRGTTFYYTKPQDVALAQALERSLIPVAGTQDDGMVKSNLYVTKHTTMPAVLVETGFISNPGDVGLLSDPVFLQRVAVGIAAGVKAYTSPASALSQTDQ
jgi:N-acetylmuramoyl-L-alanine amidase